MRNRRFKDHIRHYFKRFAEKLQETLVRVVVALSFLAIISAFGYTVYFCFFDFSLSRTIAGCISTYAFIHLNSSLNGR